MASMHWINAEKSLEQFLEEDLPFLVKPHFKDTLTIILEHVRVFQISMDMIIEEYPNFMETLNIQIYLYFAERMSQRRFSSNSDFYQCYSLIAVDYQNQFIYSIAESQIKSQYIQDTIDKRQDLDMVNI